jgi:hypothetical protein
MPKIIKGNEGRKPPEPAGDHGAIEAWINSQMPDLQPIVKRIDESIRSTLHDLQYAVKFKRAYYGLSKLGWVIEVVAYDVSVNVVFLGGADFDAPPPLGTTGRTRYIKVVSVAQTQSEELQGWIEQAGHTSGWT